MHARPSPQTLPSLRRPPPLSSPAPAHSLTDGARRGTAPPAAIAVLVGDVEAAAATATATAAATPATPASPLPGQTYGHPWNTPATLHSLASSSSAFTRHPRESPATARVAELKTPTQPPPRRPSPRATAAPALSAPTAAAVLSLSSSHIAGVGTPALTPPESAATATAMRAERLRELEGFLQQRGGRRTPLTERHAVMQKGLAMVPLLYPALATVAEAVQRYTEDVATALHRAAAEKSEALQRQEAALYEQFETFFEGKIRDLVLARQQAEAQARAEHAAAFALREERDAELTAAKEELVQRMNACEKTEDQFRDFRHLIASVFQTNEQLSLRIEQLEELLARHRIDLPPASAEMTAFLTSSEGHAALGARASRVDGGGAEDEDGNGDHESPRDGGGGGGGGARRSGAGRGKSHTIPIQFMAAAKQELVSSRLTLQEELLHSAFDDRSAYRMRIAGLTQQNLDLNFNVSELEEKVRDLYTYIHEKRFVPQVDENGNEVVLLTPRPREVPLALQTELGVELRHSTANILSELSTIAINLKHQLNSALLRARQLHTLSTWLDEGHETAGGSGGGVGGMLERVSEAAVIPVFPVSAWASVPHFLRTTVTPDVPNYFWTEAQTACILHNFFTAYNAIRRRARFVRDPKMLAPRVYQLFEHREVVLTRLDAVKEEVAESEELVPFGYVVTQFARDVLMNLSPQNVQEQLPLVLPGTVALRFPKATIVTPSHDSSRHDGGSGGAPRQRSPPANDGRVVRDCPWAEAAPVPELELARFTYNLWYAAIRHRPAQPLCELFLQLVDGQMPIETFAMTETVLGRVRRRIERLDGERTRRYAYPRLVKGVVTAVADMDATSGLRAVQAVAQTFEANHMPLYGGAIGTVALFADETYCMRETPTVSLDKEAARRAASGATAKGTAAAAAVVAAAQAVRTPLPASMITHEVPLPTSFTAASPPSMLPPIGATCIVRFCRHLVQDTLERLYTRVEATLCPLVEESEVVLGLYLLSLPRAKAALASLDDVTRQESIHAVLVGAVEPGETGAPARVTIGRISAAALAGAQLTAEAADLLGVRGVSHDYMDLLQSRKGVVEERRTAERHVTTRMVDKAVQSLPRFKTSTHFPFRAQDATWIGEAAAAAGIDGTHSNAATPSRRPPSAATSARGGGSAGGAAKRDGKKVVKRKTTEAIVPRRNGYVAVQGGSENTNTKARASLSTKRRSTRRASPANSASVEGGGRPASAKDTEADGVSAAEALLAASEEGELVEWYSLRHALRRTLPALPWQIFQPDEYEQEKAATESLSASAAAALQDAPVLTAEEVEPPH
ncbi:hypothetical protein NESM_000657900 [Novymonas esmeraldas]|uniref:DUF4456 domain-containing protein n=1 Tax=Novymonas esmeraldas TaxID=1808958 RepID=A0AAW0EVH2_9TRYP